MTIHLSIRANILPTNEMMMTMMLHGILLRCTIKNCQLYLPQTMKTVLFKASAKQWQFALNRSRKQKKKNEIENVF